jgi:glycosyltransferase involved in cell wall biosynthesis
MSGAAAPKYHRVAVVIPAHNEHANLPACLRAVVTAAVCVSVPVSVVVVLDATDDGSADLAGRYGADVDFVSVDARNVGKARAAGFEYARTLCGDDTACWYASTDADSQVDPDWLTRQLESGADMVLGVVRISDWRNHPDDVVERYERQYQVAVDGGHEHIHGANMGFSSQAYWRVGGFRALPSGEDVDLAERFDAAGYRIDRDAELSVTTSARTNARAPRGFADHLADLEGHLATSKASDCV